MKITQLKISNFRGIKFSTIIFNGDTVMVGDNNTGKSTVLEAIDLVLGPDRLSRKPVIDEHDFYAGEYIIDGTNSNDIKIEVVITDLNDEQQSHFRNHLEWWNGNELKLLYDGPPSLTDKTNTVAALRLGFRGFYDELNDDFLGETFFSSPNLENGEHEKIGINDKRKCGFLYLRTLRTGSRALSLDHGSLLDIILKIMELRPKMWESILTQLKSVVVATDPTLGISDILINVQNAIREIVPIEHADSPKILVSQMTRDHLREILTVFLATGSKTSNGNPYFAPYHHQGTGVINTLVLTLLSMIADLKDSVIFAMEEPEISIPPYTQKRIINSVKGKATQAIFTSHSPYVIQEFDPSQILVFNRIDGILTGVKATYPPAVKPKKYREEMRLRFSEALLARKVLIVEGITELDAITGANVKLNSIDPDKFKMLESLGIAIINAQSDSQVLPLCKYFKSLNKLVFALCDKQSEDLSKEIALASDCFFEAPESGMEKVIINQSSIVKLRDFALSKSNNSDWPQHLIKYIPTISMTDKEIRESLFYFFKNYKGDGVIGEFLETCDENDMPQYIIESLKSILKEASSTEDPFLEEISVNAPECIEA